MNAEKLSDHQLYALVRNEVLDKDIKSIIKKEFSKRNFNTTKLNELNLHYNELKTKDVKGLSILAKLLIVLYPFPLVLHAIIASLNIRKGANRKFNQYWNYLAIGFVFWTIIVISSAKFFYLAKVINHIIYYLPS